MRQCGNAPVRAFWAAAQVSDADIVAQMTRMFGLSAADRGIALALGHGIAIYQPMMDYQFPKIAQIGSSLPFPCQASDYHRAPIPTP